MRIIIFGSTPQQSFVLDHVGKPNIACGELHPWSEQMRELGRREHVCCKISGMVTEADWNNWSATSLTPYLDAVVEAFGPTRLLAGSDWPVCLVASSYAEWWQVLHCYFATFSQTEQAATFLGTAQNIYALSSGDDRRPGDGAAC